MINTLKSKSSLIVISTYLAFVLFWIVNHLAFESGSPFHNFFTDTYVALAIVGVYYGLKVSEDWGGSKSLMGNSIFFFNFGMIAQIFGQISYTAFYLIFKVDAPYPSIGDIGYFGSIFCYLYATWLLAKALFIRFNKSTLLRLFPALLIPIVLLSISYTLFLKGYEFDWADPVVVFLDFGYPLGQSLYVSLAIGIYILSSHVLGGHMRSKILFLIFALISQYVADFTFLYQQSRGTWEAGGTNDLTYLTAYLFMSLALLGFDDVLNKLKKKPS